MVEFGSSKFVKKAIIKKRRALNRFKRVPTLDNLLTTSDPQLGERFWLWKSLVRETCIRRHPVDPSSGGMNVGPGNQWFISLQVFDSP